jgi:hypothetical protein
MIRFDFVDWGLLTAEVWDFLFSSTTRPTIKFTYQLTQWHIFHAERDKSMNLVTHIRSLSFTRVDFYFHALHSL